MPLCTCTRRQIIAGTTLGLVARTTATLAAPPEPVRHFVAEAERMKREAIAKGDQAFGAVMVRGSEIVGYGPSRVVTSGDPNAHAERVALWEAQAKLGRKELAGCVIYSTSRPCGACQNALALAKVERMYFGADATDAGAPKSW
jgi:tRNA(Arg) A34 adenosine deaminase TadA